MILQEKQGTVRGAASPRVIGRGTRVISMGGAAGAPITSCAPAAPARPKSNRTQRLFFDPTPCACLSSSLAALLVPLHHPIMPRLTARRNKRPKTQDSGGGAASKKKREQQSDDSDDDSKSLPKPAVSTTDPSMLLYMEKLRDASDMATLYATLKLTKEAIESKREEEDLQDLSEFLAPEDIDLLTNAGTALAFLMCKKAIELCTLPKSLGGLAFAQAKADNIVRHLFETMGVAACFEDTTEKDLLKACRDNAVIDQQDLRKVLPKLKLIGVESRERIEQVRTEVQAAKENDLVIVQAYAV